MKLIKEKLMCGAVLAGGAVLVIYAASKAGEWSAGTIPVSITDMQPQTPAIILDAGHGESTKTKSHKSICRSLSTWTSR